MTVDELFICTIDDMESRVRPGSSEYDLLLVGLLLRKLLIDDDPLLDQANRQYREKIVFRVSDRLPGADFVAVGLALPNVFLLGDGLDPTAGIGNAVALRRDAFLNRDVGIANGEPFDIHALITHTANVLGGVHRSRPTAPHHAALSSLHENLDVAGDPGMLRQMRSVGSVVITALDPLRLRILEARGLL
jgi:hypothetical protein